MFCKHNRAKRNCKEGCGGNNICKHNRYKNRCKRCRLDAMCIHKVARKLCPDCKPLREIDAAGVASKMHELLGARRRCAFAYARCLPWTLCLRLVSLMRAYPVVMPNIPLHPTQPCWSVSTFRSQRTLDDTKSTRRLPATGRWRLLTLRLRQRLRFRLPKGPRRRADLP
jgi:hypothetical protein